MLNQLTEFVMKKANANRPELYLVAGLAGGVAAAIMLAKAHKNRGYKVQIAMDELHAAGAQADIYEETMVTERYSPGKKERARYIAPYAVKVVKEVVVTYGPSLTLGALSVASILRSHSEMKGRNEALMASAMVLTNVMNAYRKRVVEKYGQDVDDEMLFGAERRRYTQVVKDDTGGTRKVEGDRLHGPAELSADVYQRKFDETNWRWSVQGTNLFFLHSIEQALSDRLYLDKVVLLNDAYEMLGFERTAYGAAAGWSTKSVGDGYISFGLDRPINANNVDTDPWHLDFNVSGSVLQDLGG